MKNVNIKSRAMENRATTPKEKKEILNRIYVAWLANPELRLGQMLVNVAHDKIDLFYIEDQPLAEACENSLGFVETNK